MIPILDLPGVLDAMRASDAPVVAITPVVSGVPIVEEGEATRARSRAALLGALDRAHTATAVAELYRDVADVFVLDPADAHERPAIEALGVPTEVLPTLVHQGDAGPLTGWLLDQARAPTGVLR
jgi:LPPG:FO 2-phospho-L-lactate transferase